MTCVITVTHIIWTHSSSCSITVFSNNSSVYCHLTRDGAAMSYTSNKKLGIRRPPSSYAIFLQTLAKNSKGKGKPTHRLYKKTLWFSEPAYKWQLLSEDEKNHYRELAMSHGRQKKRERESVLGMTSDDLTLTHDVLTDENVPVAEHEFVCHLGSFSKQSVLGQGTYGVVFAFKEKFTGLTVAAKLPKAADSQTCPPVDEPTVEDIEREKNILKTFDSCWIVKCFGFAISSGGAVALLLEMAEMCLRSWLQKNPLWPRGVSRHSARCERSIQLHRWQILCQVTHALMHLHAKQVVHCDIKPANCLVFNKGAVVKLADLGCAKCLPDERQKIQGLGRHYYTEPYRAPELLLHPDSQVTFRFEADIYAACCSAFDVLASEAVLFREPHVIREVVMSKGSMTGEEFHIWRSARDTRIARAVMLRHGQEFVLLGVELKPKRQDLKAMDLFLKARVSELLP